MSGTAILRSLLAANSPLIAVIPAARIVTGDFGINAVYPGISVKKITGFKRNNLAMNSATSLVTHRIQVTLVTKVESQDAIWTLIRAALPNTRGTVNGFICDSIIPDVEGPPMGDKEALIFQESQDWFVKFAR